MSRISQEVSVACQGVEGMKRTNQQIASHACTTQDNNDKLNSLSLRHRLPFSVGRQDFKISRDWNSIALYETDSLQDMSHVVITPQLEVGIHMYSKSGTKSQAA
jgi:hypothetical protein